MTIQRASARAICDALGRARLAGVLGRGLAAVSNAAGQGAFPAQWYLVVKSLCEAEGIECPYSAFKFLKPMHSGSAILAANGTGPDTGAADPDAGPEYMGAAGARSESGIPESGCVDG